IKRALLLADLVDVQPIARDADVLVKLEPLLQPVIEPLHPFLRPAKIFELHLLELARAKSKIARIDFVPKRFPDLRDAERQFLARCFENILELNENRLGRFGPQISERRFVLGRTDVSLEHEVERPRLGQVPAPAYGALLHIFFLDELVGAQSRFARSTIDHWVAEGPL